MNSFAIRVIGVTIGGFLVSALFSFWVLGWMLESYLMTRVDEALKTEILDVSAVLELMGAPYDREEVAAELERFGHTRGINTSYCRLVDEAGKLVISSNLSAWPELENSPAQPDPGVLFAWNTHRSQEHPQGIRSLMLPMAEGLFLEVGFDLADTYELLNRGRYAYGAAMILLLTLGSVLGWVATRRPLRGIRSVGEAARKVTRDTDFQIQLELPTGSRETDELARAFSTMVHKIEALLQGQKELADSIAHDIRSPVARMRASAEADLQTTTNPALCGQVIEDCDRILNLVTVLLDISAAESGTAAWRREPLDISQLVTDAGELFQPLLEMKEQQLITKIEPNCVVHSDESVLQRVVGNLVDNAVKYTGEGGQIHLRVSGEGNQVVIQVQDTGMGMPAEALPHIFDRFYRCDASRTAPGSGLGLSFCKAAVVAMGGAIECVSETGEGTTFTVRLPG